jgi:hypothetical protein
MGLEQINETYWVFTPGPMDPHTHPRAFDPVILDNYDELNEGTEGKAGLARYSEMALRSGITAMLAMPNEFIRLPEREGGEGTVLLPYSIASLDRVRAMQSKIIEESLVPAGVFMGLDEDTLYWDMYHKRVSRPFLSREFEKVSGEVMGLKIFLSETTTTNHLSIDHAVEVTTIWNYFNPDKPVIYHVEGGNVEELLRKLEKLPNGNDIPVHVAHVSSRQELAAVIRAKKRGMNVTCEATPHHLFLDRRSANSLKGYGCVKPVIKYRGDREFLWENMHHIDMIASDCAPHRRSDKEASKPAYGVTNHTVLLPLLFGAVADGKMTMQDVYEKTCINPRKRFNMPIEDGSELEVTLTLDRSAAWYEKEALYGFNPFTKMKNQPRMIGEVVVARAGVSSYSVAHKMKQARPSFEHLILPEYVKEEQPNAYA